MKLPVLILLLFFSSLVNGQSGEVRLLSRIYADSSGGKDQIAKGLSISVAPASGALPATLLLIGLIKKDSALIDKGIKASVSIALTTVISTGMKFAVGRQRPFAAYPQLFHAKSDVGPYSFPSAHSAFAFSTATTATLCFPKWYVALPAYAWATGAAWSRLHNGVHYPTDVIMGALIGSASSFLTFKLDKWVNRKKPTP